MQHKQRLSRAGPLVRAVQICVRSFPVVSMPRLRKDCLRSCQTALDPRSKCFGQFLKHSNLVLVPMPPWLTYLVASFGFLHTNPASGVLKESCAYDLAGHRSPASTETIVLGSRHQTRAVIYLISCHARVRYTAFNFRVSFSRCLSIL